MLTKAEIKHIRSLHEKKFRELTGMFVVEGEKMVSEALNSGFEVVSIYKEEEIGREMMSRISGLSSPSPVLAVLRIPCQEIEPDISGLCLGLDGIRDPGNLGTIIRISDWFGINTVFASPDCVELFNPKVIQSSMGSIFRTRFHVADIPALCRKFRSEGKNVYGTLLDGTDIYNQKLDPEGLIVMGNESEGLSAETRKEITGKLLIPRHPSSGAESLNVAVATAVTLSEFRRR